MNREQCIQRYQDVRSWFDELVTLAEAVRQTLPPDAPVFTQSECDYDNWIGQMRAYQKVSCQRCGGFLQQDALGLGAYAVEPFIRVCNICYDEVTRYKRRTQPRLARLTAYAQEQPQLFVGLLVEAQGRLNLDDWQLEGYLQLDAAGIVRLALAQRPRAGHKDEDLAVIAGMAGCSVTVLQRLLTEQAPNSTGTVSSFGVQELTGTNGSSEHSNMEVA